MNIGIGSDHAGYALKGALDRHLLAAGHDVVDFGCHDDTPCDYPDIAIPLARAVAAGRHDFGVLICGAGIGMSIAANKVPGVRAALCYDTFSARRAREHNNANVLCLGAASLDESRARELLDVFLGAEFDGGRHARRVAKIDALDGSIAASSDGRG